MLLQQIGPNVADGLSVLDWLLRLSNVLGLIVLFAVARKIGRYEEKMESLMGAENSVANNLKEQSIKFEGLARVVYEMVGALKGTAR